MVLQLNIHLKNVESPKQRTLIVSEQSSFEELHLYLQTAFAWSSTHLHLFSQEGTSIVPQAGDLMDQPEAIDEKTVVLTDFLKSPGDQLTYIYDLNMDWQHEVILEQKAELPMDLPLPFCIAAEGSVPLEQGFKEMYSFSDNEELLEYINHQLSIFYEDWLLDEDGAEEIEPDEAEWNQLFHAADQVKADKPWLDIRDDQFIAVWSDRINDYVYCSIMGNAEESFGVSGFLGNRGLLSYLDILEKDPFEDDVALFFNQYSLTAHFNNREELSEDEYDLIKSLNRKYRGKHQWPSFVSMVPDTVPWSFNQEECWIFTEVLTKLDAFFSRTKNLSKKVPSFDDGEILALNKQGEQIILSINKQIIKAVQVPALELELSEIEWKRMRKKIDKINGVEMELAFIQAGEPVQRTPESRPFLPYILVLIDRNTGAIVHYDLVDSVYYTKGIQEKIFHLFDKIETLPKTVYMFDDFFAMHGEPLFNQLSLPLVKTEELHGVNQFINMMEEDGPF
ncbi:plasmid pRiA4b ORF-3 family protein [Oceanobacillus timonensis]|uniref:plasmid pRiA4b ORF-3 family protein n=1 Tax=Oceanobacillus timonensis TaxID=1926285 RepID=UPI0015C44279|nr:plasmid pRiA4b ORF-3 family protein [Oceanobacillus timonensis]